MTPFRFSTKLELIHLLGRKARNAVDLRSNLREAPMMSVYYHTHRFLQQHHYLSPEPPNDFAYWVTNVLNDDYLGEQLASIDVVQFTTIEQIRQRILEILDTFCDSAEQMVDCPRGEEFHFMSCQVFAFPTSHVATSLREFRAALQEVSINAIYYHMFDARLRPEVGMNDFSLWFRDNGYGELAEEVNRLDPYTRTLEGLRRTILKLVEAYDTD